jgi:hypothetical protein
MSICQRSTTEKFIEKAKIVHGDKYDYSKINYLNSRTKVTIICPIHGEFQTRPDMHIDKRGGRGCPDCGYNIVSKEEFIKRASVIHKNKYDYSKIKYTDTKTKILITCSDHGDFKQTPEKHMAGQGCGFCSRSSKYGSNKITNEIFINESRKIHGNKYDYSKVKVVNIRTKVIITCSDHGDFEQNPAVHSDMGLGCPRCTKDKSGANVSSSGDKWLDSLGEEVLEREKTMIIGNRRFKVDGFNKDTNTIYEYFGTFWHGHPSRKDLKGIHPFKKISYAELYQETLDRIQHLKDNGYKIIYEWGR